MNDMSPLAEHESELFDRLCDLRKGSRGDSTQRIALVRGGLDDDEVAIVCCVSKAGEVYHVEPLAILVDEEILTRLTDSEGRGLI